MYLLLKVLELHLRRSFFLDQVAGSYPSQNQHQPGSMDEFGPTDKAMAIFKSNNGKGKETGLLYFDYI